MSTDRRDGSSVGGQGDERGEIGDERGEIGDESGEIGDERGEIGDERGEIGDERGEFVDERGEESDSDMEPVVLWVPERPEASLRAAGVERGAIWRRPAWPGCCGTCCGPGNSPAVRPTPTTTPGGIAITVVLMVFAGFSILLHVFRMGYFAMMVGCKPTTKILSAFIEGPFLALQTYLLWAHSKDCIHRHKIQTRSGLILTLCTDVLLWMNAVTEDTMHMEIELEREAEAEGEAFSNFSDYETFELINATLCQCGAYSLCLLFRKGFEVLYPFNMEYYLMAGCMLYVMWKNVGRSTDPRHGQPVAHRLTLRMVRRSGVVVGPLAGGAVLLVGVVLFVLYQVWVGHRTRRKAAFMLFYGYHLVLVPAMSLASLAGTLVHALERRARGKGGGEAGHNPARSLDVLLLVGAALGQLSLSYFSLVAALAVGPQGIMGNLDLAYSLLCLLELILQNVFIIDGLNGPDARGHAHQERGGGTTGRSKKKKSSKAMVELPRGVTLLEPENAATAPSVGGNKGSKKPWTRRAKQEICAFLILSNIM
ncbi:hypothetical protein SKAU_G00429620, partial [Synaphobranchus kaupii]